MSNEQQYRMFIRNLLNAEEDAFVQLEPYVLSGIVQYMSEVYDLFDPGLEFPLPQVVPDEHDVFLYWLWHKWQVEVSFTQNGAVILYTRIPYTKESNLIKNPTTKDVTRTLERLVLIHDTGLKTGNG